MIRCFEIRCFGIRCYVTRSFVIRCYEDIPIPLQQSKGLFEKSLLSVLHDTIVNVSLVDSECVLQQPLDVFHCTDIASILDESILRKMSDLEK